MTTDVTPLVFVDDATDSAAIEAAPTALVIGNFDGVHKGHQAVLAEAKRIADARGLPVSVLTFTPHPAGVLGRAEPLTLTSLERKAELLVRHGASRVYARKFDLAFAAWSPERFVEQLLAGVLCAKAIVVGADFRFGAKRAGDLAMLRALASRFGADATSASIVSDGRAPYKSSRARDAVLVGDLGEAIAVLGRPHSFAGTVVHGDARGRTIGFPTANLDGIVELVPPNGVYAVAVDAHAGPAGAGRGRALGKGVMNVGVRPTVGGDPSRRVEVHLFDLDRDLYGATLRVHLIARLRAEQKFESFDALKAQIEKDADAGRAALASLDARDGAYG